MQKLRNKPKVKELNIPKDTLQELQKSLAAKNVTEKTKYNLIKEMIEYSPCNMCAGIPKFQVIYNVGQGATRIEYYCGNGCYETLSKREEEEPTSKDQVADYYGCIKA